MEKSGLERDQLSLQPHSFQTIPSSAGLQVASALQPLASSGASKNLGFVRRWAAQNAQKHTHPSVDTQPASASQTEATQLRSKASRQVYWPPAG